MGPLKFIFACQMPTAVSINAKMSKKLPGVRHLATLLLVAGSLAICTVYVRPRFGDLDANNHDERRAPDLLIKTEYQLKKPIFASVLTQRKYLNTIGRAIRKTWGIEGDISGFNIFVGGDRDSVVGERLDLPVTALPAVSDLSSYDSSLIQTFEILKYLHFHHADHYDWFLLTYNDTYIVSRELLNLVNKMDPNSFVYFGKAEFVSEERQDYFCSGRAGVLLSNRALAAIVPYLEQCFHSIAHLKNKVINEGLYYTERGDAGLGYCMKRSLGVTCSTSVESQAYFFHDKDGQAQRAGIIWDTVIGNALVSIYPVTSEDSMQKIHLMIKAKELAHLKQLTSDAEAALCQQLPHESAPMFGVCTRQPQPTPLTHDAAKSEFQSWQTIRSNMIYSEDSELPAVPLPSSLSAELNLLLSNAIYHINTEEPSELSFKKLSGAMVRYNGVTGREAILDIELWNQSNETVNRRAHLRRPPSEVVSVKDTGGYPYHTTVHVIVPISNVGERFRAFLKGYARNTHQQFTKLILVVFGQDDLAQVNSLVARYTGHLNISVVRGEGEFTRGRALDQGLYHLANDQLAFLCDIDMIIDASFWDHCRLNAVRGSRVYYPVFFSLYNMDYVYHNKAKPSSFWLSREHGHWVWYSYGMVCIYKSDYIASGGFDTTIVGWGGEDTDFFKRVLKAKLEVIKAPDASLIHRWHPKDCSLSLTPQQYHDCLGSKAEALAGKKELAEYIFHLNEQ